MGTILFVFAPKDKIQVIINVLFNEGFLICYRQVFIADCPAVAGRLKNQNDLPMPIFWQTAYQAPAKPGSRSLWGSD
jgi:hypothetical protein